MFFVLEKPCWELFTPPFLCLLCTVTYRTPFSCSFICYSNFCRGGMLVTPKLQVRNLSYSYHSHSGETKALSHISFDVADGEFLAVVGPSGCGKSTLLSLLCGLLTPEEGSIVIDGIDRRDSPAVIGYMLQKTIFSNGVPFSPTQPWVLRSMEMFRPMIKRTYFPC